jgi:hypothetical protein
VHLQDEFTVVEFGKDDLVVLVGHGVVSLHLKTGRAGVRVWFAFARIRRALWVDCDMGRIGCDV